MGRETRQARRARERRELQKRRQHSSSLENKYSLLAVGAIALALVAVLATIAFAKTSSNSSASATPTVVIPTAPAFTTVDGIKCETGGEVTTYHQHAHLALFYQGKPVAIPTHIGFNYNYDCLYWLHTHDSSGVIHMEAPSKISPPLSTFFAVWHQPINAHRIGKIKIKPGQQVRVWINTTPYHGNPATIRLHPHENITIEVGAPWVKPVLYNYAAQQL